MAIALFPRPPLLSADSSLTSFPPTEKLCLWMNSLNSAFIRLS